MRYSDRSPLWMTGASLVLLVTWLTGTYVLDRVKAPDWAYLMWIGGIMATWLIGGNVLYYKLRGEFSWRSGLNLAFGAVILCVAAYVIFHAHI